jgi:hypothetical protein
MLCVIFISYSNNVEHTIFAQMASQYYETFLLALMFQVEKLPNLNRYLSSFKIWLIFH